MNGPGNGPPDALPGDAAELHARIGLSGVDRGYLTLRQLTDAMQRVGAAPYLTPSEVWVQPGLLDRTELAEIVAFLRVSPQNTPPTEVRAVARTERDESEESLNLADVVRTQDGERGDRPTAVHPAVDSSRYILGGELGRGGVGRVLKAFDRDLGRSVAMKVPLHWPLPEAEAEKFIEEAQATGQLEHPNIVPIYDVGRLASGEFYYTMKRVRAYSLRDVIDGLIRGDEEIAGEYGTTRLLSIFLRVCQAMHYAHVRGVIHRDLKPDNIMLGQYGEVHVMDWGLARIMDRDVVTDRSLQGSHRDEAGQTVGTPAYMPPEQAKGNLEEIDERSDIYSLGAILYEMVTLKQPSTRSNVMATLMAVMTEPIPPPSQVSDATIAEELEHIVMRALEKDPERRFASAKELHDAVEKVLDGRNEREAMRGVEEGERHMRLFEQWRREMTRLAEEVHDANARIEDWQSIEVKRQIWDLEDAHRQASMRMVSSFGEANRQFTQALAHVPDHAEARAKLAELFFSRYELAEQQENELDKVYYRSQFEQFDDDGRFQARLRDSAPVSAYTDPERASVFLYSLEESDRRLVPKSPRFLGESPIPEQFIRAGRYLVRVKHPSRPGVLIPLDVSRSDPISLNIHLPEAAACKPGFVYVPGGTSIVGGDPEAFDPLPMQRAHVESFFIQKVPVTFAEYAEFLDAIGADEASTRAPRTRGSDAPLMDRGADGRHRASDALIDGDMRARYPLGEGHESRIPILAIRYEDAIAYCTWRAGRDGVAYRLPNELEWERAARGADGRHFPWGDRFDANFCKMSGSRAIESQPEPVGAFTFDRSPFDVFDLAGGVREWVESPADDTYAVVRGGYWNGDERACRLSSRWRFHRNARLATVGFRLAYSLNPSA